MKLSEEKRKFAEKNHNLIYYYLHSRNLNYEEFYDIVAIGLCKAAKSYDPTKGFTFSAFACKCMYNEVGNYLAKESKRFGIKDTSLLSLDDAIPNREEDKDSLVINTIESASYLPESEIEAKMMEETLDAILTDQERQVFHYRLESYNQSAIGRKMGLSRQRVNTLMGQIKKKWIGIYNV